MDPIIRDQPGSYSSFRYLRDTFAGAGQDSFTAAFSQSQEQFSALTNIMPIAQGSLQRRWGYSLFSSAPAWPVQRIYSYQRDADGTRRLVLTSASGIAAINEDGTAWNSSVFTLSGGAGIPRMVASRDYAYFSDGVSADLQKWNGNATGGVSNWGITAPVTAISLGAPVGSGAITLLNGRDYFVVFKNSTTGQHSDLSPVSASSGPLTAQNQPLSNIPVSIDPQVDKKVILATLDGGDQTTLYFVTELTNATTTYTDVTSDTTLVDGNIFLETDDFGTEHGVTDNDPPPNITLPIKHKGRIYGMFGQFIYFSKSVAEVTTSTGIITGRYEECWPAVNFMDISEGAETIRARQSDGNVLYVATEKCVRRIAGDGPLNFQNPETVFNETGVLSQEVWQVIFHEGQPIGMNWLTPDFRVISSDFNTYKDIGTPIQDVLNSINQAAVSTCWAGSFSRAAFDLYILAIPTGSNTSPDTLCVYDLRNQRWLIWKPTDLLTAGLFNINASGIPQWIIAASTDKIYQFLPTATQDRVGNTPVSFTCTIVTPWMHLGEPARTKHLNEMEVATDDANLLLSVDGATTEAQLSAPNAVTPTPKPPAIGPRGTFKYYLASNKTIDRYYRFTWSSTGTAQTILSYLDIEAIPVHSL